MNANSLLEIETRIIGAVLHDDAQFARCAFLTNEAFNDRSNADIWEAICRMKAKGARVTPASLSMQASSLIEPLGGLPFLLRLAGLGESILTDLDQAVDRLYEEMQWRHIATLSARLEAATARRDKKPEAIFSGLIDIAQKNLSGGHTAFRRKSEVAKAAITSALEPAPIVTTGIDSLDMLMQGGLKPKRLYAFLGEYGRGKTILAGTCSENINIQGVPHLFMSMETPPEDIEIRNCARHLNLNASTLLDANDPEYSTFASSNETYLERAPNNTLYDFCPGATIDQIHRNILAAKSRHGIKGFILDYWQLVRGRERGQSEEAHFQEVSDRLAAICRTENLWGIVTAQVDAHGRLKYNSLLHSASLAVRLVRDENDSAAYFVCEKSNYTRYADTGNESVPGMIFDDHVGPFFRNTEATDMADLSHDDKIRL